MKRRDFIALASYAANASSGKAIRRCAGVVLLSNDVMLTSHLERIGPLVLKHRLPAISPWPVAAKHALAAYRGVFAGGNPGRSAAAIVDKIFKGAKPGDLPFEQPMKFELVVNLKMANALGVSVPPAMLLQATRIIE